MERQIQHQKSPDTIIWRTFKKRQIYIHFLIGQEGFKMAVNYLISKRYKKTLSNLGYFRAISFNSGSSSELRFSNSL